MQKILLCPPTFFDIEYAINPWMDIDTKINSQKVWHEFETLKNIYRKIGVTFDELSPTKGLPDQVFTTDIGVPLGKLFVRSNFKYGQRKPESFIGSEYFENKGYAIFTIPPSISYEGEGDLIKMEDTFYMGWGQRTSYEAAEYLSIALRHEVIPIKLINPSFFHLDTCFAPLTKDTAIYYPGAFSFEGTQILASHFEDLIPIEKKDADAFACNVIIIGKNIIMHNGLSSKLSAIIESYGFTIYGLDMTEYLKGGGSVKCVSLQIFD